MKTPSHEDHLLQLLLQIKNTGPNNPPFEEVNLTPSSFAYLHAVQQAPKLTLNEICDQLKVAPASASIAIKRLEADGLVIRETNPHDQRSSLFLLSKEGEKLHHHIQTFRQEKAKLLLDRLSPEEQLVFLTLFQKLLTTQ